MKVFYLLEQPIHRSTGGLQGLERFRAMVKATPAGTQVIICDATEGNTWHFSMLSFLAKVYRYEIRMSSFGAPTQKPSWIYSQHRRFQDCLVSALCNTSMDPATGCRSDLFKSPAQGLARLSEAGDVTKDAQWKTVKKQICKVSVSEPGLNFVRALTIQTVHTYVPTLHTCIHTYMHRCTPAKASGKRNVSGTKEVTKPQKLGGFMKRCSLL